MEGMREGMWTEGRIGGMRGETKDVMKEEISVEMITGGRIEGNTDEKREGRKEERIEEKRGERTGETTGGQEKVETNSGIQD